MSIEIKPDVLQAIQELEEAYGKANVEVIPEQQGGAFIIVKNISISEKYNPSLIWCGFLITFNYPHADVYPHYVNGDLKRMDDGSLGAGFSIVDWQSRSTQQISRRSNNWNPASDTAELKLAKIVQWLNSL